MRRFATRSNVLKGWAPGALAVVGCIAVASAARAGAWTLPHGKGQVIISAVYSEADEFLGSDGQPAKGRRFSKGETAFYAEYGLTDGFTMMIEGNASSTSNDAPIAFDEARWGLGSVGGRLRLWESGGSILSLEAAARLLPRESGDSVVLPVEAQGDVRLRAGRSFTVGAMPAFADLALGYRFAMPIEASAFEERDDITVDLALGLRPWTDWTILAQTYNRMETGRGQMGDSHRSHKLEASFVHDLSPSLSVQLGVLTTVAGRNALREKGLVGAVWMRF